MKHESGNIRHTSDGSKWAFGLNCSQEKHLLPDDSVNCFPVLVDFAEGYFDFTDRLLQLKIKLLIKCRFMMEEPSGGGFTA